MHASFVLLERALSQASQSWVFISPFPLPFHHINADWCKWSLSFSVCFWHSIPVSFDLQVVIHAVSQSLSWSCPCHLFDCPQLSALSTCTTGVMCAFIIVKIWGKPQRIEKCSNYTKGKQKIKFSELSDLLFSTISVVAPKHLLNYFCNNSCSCCPLYMIQLCV